MRTVRVLVVEDAEGVREALTEILDYSGYEVLAVASVLEAEALRRCFGLRSLDLVITDLRLTRLPQAREEVDLIQRWHVVMPSLPFILISNNLRSPDLGDLPRGVVSG
jgi:CheY-like chemotaxis protein